MLSLKHHDLGTAKLGLRANANPIRKRDAKAAERADGPDIMMYADECTFCQQRFDVPSKLAQHWQRTHLHKGIGIQYTKCFGSLECIACPNKKRKTYARSEDLTVHLQNPNYHDVGELLA